MKRFPCKKSLSTKIVGAEYLPPSKIGVYRIRKSPILWLRHLNLSSCSAIMKRYTLLIIIFSITGTLLAFQIEFERTTPLYMKNFIEPQIETVALDLSDLWNIELEFPLYVEIARKRTLGASGEASFDGKLFRLFMTPVTDAIPSLIRHEMMHVYTFQWLYSNQISDAPLWFLEGLAVWYERHNGVNISDVNPVSLFKEIDVLSVDQYPSGDAFARYYSFLADFFFHLDSEIDIRDSFDGILSRLKATGDFDNAFVDHKRLNSIYRAWKSQRLFMSILGFVIMQFSWFVPAIVIVFLGLWTYVKRKNIRDVDIRELERRYGKNYWKDYD